LTMDGRDINRHDILTMDGRDINRHDIFKTREANFAQIFHSPSMLHTLWFKIPQFLNWLSLHKLMFMFMFMFICV